MQKESRTVVSSCFVMFLLLPKFTMGLTTEGSGRPITQAAPANQKGTINILHENTNKWPPYLPHKLKHNNGAKD